jgi:excisionase family DNA binding protein
MMMAYITVAKAAQTLGVSRSTIYRRAQRGVLSITRENGRIMVEIATVPETKADPVAARVTMQSPVACAAPHSGGGQRELVPRQSVRIGFFQSPTWL